MTDKSATNNSSLQGFDPLNPRGLSRKFAKHIAKGLLLSVDISYSANGVNVSVTKADGTKMAPGAYLEAHKAAKAAQNVQGGTEAEKLAKVREDFQIKYEFRLNKECVQALLPVSVDGTRAAIMALPFEDRRIMLMSNEQFKATKK